MKRSIPSLTAASGEGPRGIDAPGLKLTPAAPITDLGRAVKHLCDIGNGGPTGRLIRQIASYDFDAERVKKRCGAARANQGTHAVASADHSLGQVTSEQPRGAG